MSEFFAGANTEKGFTGYFPHYFKDIGRLYIIKGTAGSGKATLLKRFSEHWEKRGERVLRIRCSSDTDSLDGVIVPRLKIAAADGTAPHLLEASLPLVKERTFDICRYMTLPKDRKSLSESVEKKRFYFEKAYNLILCGVTAARTAEDMITEGADKDELFSECKGFYQKHLRCCEKGSADKRLPAAFNKNGLCFANTFPNTLLHFSLSDCDEARYTVLDMFSFLARDDGQKITLCPHPTDTKKLCGIYFHSSDLFLTDGSFKEKAEPLSLLSGNKKSTSPLAKKSRALSENAFGIARVCLEKAAKQHQKAEKIYSRCVDFDAMTADANAFLELDRE